VWTACRVHTDSLTVQSRRLHFGFVAQVPIFVKEKNDPGKIWKRRKKMTRNKQFIHSVSKMKQKFDTKSKHCFHIYICDIYILYITGCMDWTVGHRQGWGKRWTCSRPTTMCDLPDMGVLLQALQSMLGVVKDAMPESQLCPWRATDRGLPRCPILHGKTGTNVTNWHRLDVSCNIMFMHLAFYPKRLTNEYITSYIKKSNNKLHRRNPLVRLCQRWQSRDRVQYRKIKCSDRGGREVQGKC